MRSGDFKETIAQQIVLTDSNVVKFWSVLLLLALVGAPYIVGPYTLSYLTIIMFTAISALGLTILTGYCGLISLGQVGFLILGAYAYAVPVVKFGMSPLLGFLLAGLVPAAASLIVGAPSLRLKGLYLAITTLAFAFIINHVVLEAEWLTNGARGLRIRRPVIFDISFRSDAGFYWLCLFFAVLTLFATLNIKRSRVGRAFGAIRDNDIAARAMGINLHYYKLLAFAVSSFITGIAGALYGIFLSYVAVESFPFLLSIEALAIIIVGGMGSVLGAIMGTVFIVLLPEMAQFLFALMGSQIKAMLATGAHEVKSMLYGLAIILFLRLEPRGLVGIWLDARRLWVNWPLRF